MNTRQAIEDYVYFRNQMDIKKLQNPIQQNYHLGLGFSHYFYPYQANVGYQTITPKASNYDQSDSYQPPWLIELDKMLHLQPYQYQYYRPLKDKITFEKPLTKSDDVQFKQFTGLNPNQMSYYNLVEHKMINPFTRQPWPQFVGKIKPVYNGFSMLPIHFSLTPEMKRQITYAMAERQGFRGYNQY